MNVEVHRSIPDSRIVYVYIMFNDFILKVEVYVLKIVLNSLISAVCNNVLCQYVVTADM